MTASLINKILAGTLGVQVLLAAVVWWPRGETLGEAQDLIPVDAAQLKRITIDGALRRGEVQDDALVLERGPQGWTIASAFNYPAADENLEPLFEDLDQLMVRAPVSTQAYSHSAMNVAEDEYARKIVVETESGETIGLYLGAAAGKASHVRLADGDEVYRVRGFSALGLPDTASRYFDRDFQKVDVDTVTSMTIARPGQDPIVFAKIGDAWTLPDRTPPGMVVDQAQAKAFLQTALNLRMLEPHGTQVTPEMGFDDGIVVTWSASDEGTTIEGEYRVGREIPDENGRIYLKSNQSPYVFEALIGQLQHARERGVNELFTTPPIDIDEPGDEPGAP